ncbi:MAG: hypothetical protein J1F07_07625 [Muribaculaceae bacterium]|nr:hypothetical protein [Muribaculaceae bacterium]
MARVPRIEFRNRIVDPITTAPGQHHYYDFLDYWRVCYSTENKCRFPTIEEAKEYIRLSTQKSELKSQNSFEARKNLVCLRNYETKYDWRPQLKGTEGAYGLYTPDGRQMLSAIYHDIFRQFDAYSTQLPYFIPVFNGTHWGMVSLSDKPEIVLDFKYSKIIVERWDYRYYFVQDATTKKWGAYHTVFELQQSNAANRKQNRIPVLEQYLDCIVDEIYEDELLADEAPITFFMLTKGDRIGIMNDFGITEIDYDYYETDDENFLIKLHSGSNCKIIDFNNPCCAPANIINEK